MNDKNLMENILQLEKAACDLFMHGTLESSTPQVHQSFSSALNDCLRTQSVIYEKMSAKGWYPSEQVEQTKIDTLKQKYSA